MKGCVALCCGESDRKLMHRQIWRAMNAAGIERADREYAMSQIRFFALAGKEVNMLRGTIGNNLERTDFLDRFTTKLRKHAEDGNFTWAAIILDPFSRFAGPDSEKDNAAATQFVQALETLCALPGTPAVICATHSSKQSITNGRNDTRGVTAIRDAMRSVMVMTRHKTETVVGVHLSCDKSNEAPHFQDRWLVQEQGKLLGGTLRLATEPEAAMLEESAHPKKRKSVKQEVVLPARPNLHDAIVKALRDIGGSAASRNWLWERHLSGYRKSDVWSAFALLIESGEVTIDGHGKTRGKLTLVNEARQQVLPLKGDTDE